jgi:hypothetical protein
VNSDLSNFVTITLGNGVGDVVSAEQSAGDTITVGNGAGDAVDITNSGLADIVTVGNGAGDMVDAFGSGGNTITLGSGDGDVVDAQDSFQNTITLGNGNGDTVFGGISTTITLGNGNDTIHVGLNNTITAGRGQDVFAFDQIPSGRNGNDESKPGGIGTVTITGFNPSKDLIVIQQTLQNTNPYSVHDDAHGNAVITFQGDTTDSITLVGVHSSALHASDFHFV